MLTVAFKKKVFIKLTNNENYLFIYFIEKTNATGHEIVWVAPPSKSINNSVYINIAKSYLFLKILIRIFFT